MSDELKRDRLHADQMAVVRQKGELHSTTCALVAEHGRATECSGCNPIRVDVVQ